jgi:rhodanese-related sulfurtransferase
MIKRSLLAVFALFFIAALTWDAAAKDYHFIGADALNSRLQASSSMIIIDICEADQFAKGHIKGAIETNAYPVKTDDQESRLAEHLNEIKSSSDDVIIVCPRGAGGAKRTYDFYQENGVAEKRLLILEKGQNGWPYETEKKE